MTLGHFELTAPEATLVLGFLAAFLVLACGFMVRRAVARRRAHGLAIPLLPASGPAPSSPAAIVTERLTDTAFTELLHDAIPIDPLSPLSSQVSNIAGFALQVAVDATPGVVQRGRFLVEFSAEGSAALRSESVALLRRVDSRLQPTLVNRASQFKENATLVGRAGRTAASAAAVANVVVLLAVQAQLVSIERTLERLEKKIGGVRQFLDAKEISRVRGWLRKLASLRDEIGAGPWSDADRQRWLGVLEMADAELLQVEELAKQQCEAASNEITRATLSATLLGKSGTALLNEFLGEVARYEQYHEIRSLAIVGRLVVGYLKTTLGAPSGARQIQQDIDNLVAAAAAHHENVAKRAREFKTVFRSKAYEEERQGAVGDEAAEFRRRSTLIVERLRGQLVTMEGDVKRTARAIVEVTDDGTLRPIAMLPGLDSDESRGG